MISKNIKKVLVYTTICLCSFLYGYTSITQEAIATERSGISDFDLFGKLSNSLSDLNLDEKVDLTDKYNNAKSISNSVIGWIYIPSTQINYPIAHGQNSYYLNRTWDGKSSLAGSIFMDEGQMDWGTSNLIHGHNMKNGTMFTDLKNYFEADFFKANVPIYIYDGTTTRKFQVISLFKTDPSISFKFNVPENDVQSYASELKSKSVYATPDVSSRPLIILNTCVSDGSDNHYIIVGQEVDYEQ